MRMSAQGVNDYVLPPLAQALWAIANAKFTNDADARRGEIEMRRADLDARRYEDQQAQEAQLSPLRQALLHAQVAETEAQAREREARATWNSPMLQAFRNIGSGIRDVAVAGARAVGRAHGKDPNEPALKHAEARKVAEETARRELALPDEQMQPWEAGQQQDFLKRALFNLAKMGYGEDGRALPPERIPADEWGSRGPESEAYDRIPETWQGAEAPPRPRATGTVLEPLDMETGTEKADRSAYDRWAGLAEGNPQEFAKQIMAIKGADPQRYSRIVQEIRARRTQPKK